MMRQTPPRLLVVAVVAAAVGGLGLSTRAADDEDFQNLVQGDDPGQFLLVGIGPDTLKIVDGEIHVTGTPNGYFATKDSYKNYILRFDWMYERPDDLVSDEQFNGNSGLLVHIQGEHKVWPKCTEVQLLNRDAGHIFAINGAQFQSEVDAADRKAAQKQAIKPVGEWNEMEVVCQDGRIVATINGVEIDRGHGADPDHGQFGLQSEGRPIRFRNLTIKVLD